VEKAEEKLDELENMLGKIGRKLVKLEERRNGLDGELEKLKNA
jgi:chromosome segregation ATPase